MKEWLKRVYQHHTQPKVIVNVEITLPSGTVITGLAEDIDFLTKLQMVSLYIDNKLYVVHASCVSFEITGASRFNQNELLYHWKHK